jgi:hypothetical protein
VLPATVAGGAAGLPGGGRDAPPGEATALGEATARFAGLGGTAGQIGGAHRSDCPAAQMSPTSPGNSSMDR